MVAVASALRGSDDPGLLRGGYQMLAITDELVLIPLGLATLISGLAGGLISPWGILRHHWVRTKLVLVLLAVTQGSLLLHSWTTSAAAAAHSPAILDAATTRTLLIAGNIVAVGLLIASTALSVVKPWGLTARGRRRAQRARHRRGPVGEPVLS